MYYKYMYFPEKTNVFTVGFDGPPKLAADAKTKEETLDHYHHASDEIRAFVETLPSFFRNHNIEEGQ